MVSTVQGLKGGWRQAPGLGAAADTVQQPSKTPIFQVGAEWIGELGGLAQSLLLIKIQASAPP